MLIIISRITTKKIKIYQKWNGNELKYTLEKEIKHRAVLEELRNKKLRNKTLKNTAKWLKFILISSHHKVNGLNSQIKRQRLSK